MVHSIIAAPALPTGTVTFLFTDVEDSTRLWDQYAGSMAEALATHDAIIERLTSQHRGVVVRPRGEGDSRFVVFSQASDAVAAACDIQIALGTEPWPLPEPLFVRVALHTGEADMRDGDYYGSDVNRCARLRAIARGGQVLLSGTTAALVRERLPADASLRALGSHRLRGLIAEESVFQLLHPMLSDRSSSLASAALTPGSYPVATTPLLGRERELNELRDLVLRPELRLLTLTGPGGSGKTRLAMQLAADLHDRFPDGAYFVGLAPVRDASGVGSAIAETLGVRETPLRPISESLADHLRGRRMLLILDNFEQVLAAATLVSGMLAASDGLKTLVTSRAVLRVGGEYEYAVPPLALPDIGKHTDPAELATYGSVQLFAQRARAASPDFALTAANAAAVVEICHRLDGLPLAIELAAARIRVIPPDALAQHLERRLPLLTRGGSDRPVRQQSLRNTIQWSYDLLEPAEQQVFRDVAVFSGAFTLEAAAAVCELGGGSLLELLDPLEDLIGKSLLKRMQDGATPRFSMLETVREYALEQLEQQGADTAAFRRSAHYFAGLAEDADAHLRDEHQLESLALLEREHDNLMGALGWSTASADADLTHRLAAALRWFWVLRAPGEGRMYLERAMSMSEEDSPLRIAALRGLVEVAWAARSPDLFQLLDECLRVCTRAGDAAGVAWARHIRGERASVHGDVAQASSLLEASVATLREHADEWYLARALLDLAAHVQRCGEGSRAHNMRVESLSLFQAIGDRWGMAQAMADLVPDAVLNGDEEAALRFAQRSLELADELRDVRSTSRSLTLEAWLAARNGDPELSDHLLAESSALARATGNQYTVGRVFNMYGEQARERGDFRWAAELYERSLELFSETTSPDAIASVTHNLGHAVLRLGDVRRAARLFHESLSRLSQNYHVHALVGASGVALTFGRAEIAVQLLGAAHNELVRRGITLENPDQAEYDHQLAMARAQLDTPAFDASWRQGETLTMAAAVVLALGTLEP